MPRRVSARRTLAVVAAALALPWPLLALGYVDDGDAVWAVVCAALIAAIVAGPLLAGSPRFGWVAGGLWFLLLALGFLFALGGGYVMWPAAFVFLVAALPGPDATWPTRRVLSVAGGVIALGAAAVAVAAVVQDARDDPDLSVRLRPGASANAFTSRAVDDPHVRSVGGTFPQSAFDVELRDGLTPVMRERLADKLRRDPAVRSVRVVDEGLWP